MQFDMFENALASIRMGVEDYHQNTPERSLTAVRNIYSGVLLLAKEVLCRQDPNADVDLILAEKYKPVIVNGQVEIQPHGIRTIDFQSIASRFKDFGIKFNFKGLSKLQDIRNDAEHKFTNEPHAAVQAVIASSVPSIFELIRLCGETPTNCLGDTWELMLKIQGVYDSELSGCIQSFSAIDFPFDELTDEPFICLECDSELVEQLDASNDDHTCIQLNCRSCNDVSDDSEKIIEEAIVHKYGWEIHRNHGADGILDTCPECGLDTYVYGAGCVWCGIELGDCGVCGNGIDANTADPDDRTICGSCGNRINKARDE